MNPLQDGIDHINVYSGGNTELGRLLSNFARTLFFFSEKECYSLEGFWFWLATGKKHNHLLTLHGYEAKKEGKKYPRVEVEDFKEQIKLAITAKILQNKRIRELLVKSNLPLKHYYVGGDMRYPKIKLLPQFDWMISHISRLRTSLQNLGSIKAVNMHFEKGDYYCGREDNFKNVGINMSCLGNPFPMSKAVSRKESIASYRVWLWDRMQDENSEQSKALNIIGADAVKRPIKLACFCSPQSCHVDVIIKAIKYKWNQKQ